MSAKFFALLTVIGANKLAKATALGTTLKITQMAVGDGGGTLPTPDTQQTKLVGEKRRAGLNTLFVDPKNDSQIIAEQVIPENEGGYWIREIGLFDDEGSLIAVGNCPETYKPQLQEGSGRTQTIRMILTVSHTESVELKVDPSVILATREFVNDAIESASKQTLAEVAKLYATKTELSTGLNKVQKSADDANTNANSRVPSTRKVNNKPLSTDITLTASDVGAATPAQVNEAKTAASNAQAIANSGVNKADAAQKTANDAVSKANAAQTAANNANTNANGRVPSTRKINNKPLSADISLTAGDVGAATPAQVNEAKTAASNAQNTANNGVSKADAAQKTANDAVNKANAAQTAANNANTNANGRVPSTRKINNKPLSADITLTAGDVGAATPAQVNEAKTAANNANNNANGRVPNTRKVNGKPLSADIRLTAGDVGALTQGQADARYQTKGTNSKLKLIWNKFVGSGGVVDLPEDIRGKFALIATNINVEIYALTYFPTMDNIEVEVHRGSTAFCRLKITNGGKRITVASMDCGLYKIILLD
ncbi:TPA: phage tail protein [Proteus mirabilis]|uniref:Phage tail protein n=4 Tax=Proteus mirabilis TaxID=584 RepID=A0AAN1EUW2_PROMI|nr:phage tail protein [Proteus mirabilis]DAH69834.1 MAG TPA: tail collar fiber protein [Caudoviricetes sp.]ARX34078.1 phage tail protein [Proteus mirabilis]MCR1830590.1 phage tail protein [Proteus mirabilis]MDZ7518279.1 phage tail protein [Proteus mirabilis]MEB3114005.1 phage tail protein [Proteus mirabilis]